MKIDDDNLVQQLIRVNSIKAFEKDKKVSLVSNIMTFIDFPEVNPTSGSGGQYVEYIDDNNALLVVESEIYGGTYKKRGDFKINIHSMKIDGVEDIDVNFNFKVDFSNSFNKVIDKRVDKMVKIGEEETYIRSLQSTILGTHINFTTFDLMKYGKFVLEIDGKIYRFISWGDGEEGAHTFINELTYNEMKNAKNIKIIPIYKEDINEEVQLVNKQELEITELMKLPQKLDFALESQGYIYNIEKTNGKMRVYYDNGDRTLAELSFINIYGEGEMNTAKSVIEKDPNRENGYFIEREIEENKKYFVRIID